MLPGERGEDVQSVLPFAPPGQRLRKYFTRALLQCQKRPVSVKRDLLQCQKRPITDFTRALTHAHTRTHTSPRHPEPLCQFVFNTFFLSIMSPWFPCWGGAYFLPKRVLITRLKGMHSADFF